MKISADNMGVLIACDNCASSYKIAMPIHLGKLEKQQSAFRQLHEGCEKKS